MKLILQSFRLPFFDECIFRALVHRTICILETFLASRIFKFQKISSNFNKRFCPLKLKKLIKMNNLKRYFIYCYHFIRYFQGSCQTKLRSAQITHGQLNYCVSAQCPIMTMQFVSTPFRENQTESTFNWWSVYKVEYVNAVQNFC